MHMPWIPTLLGLDLSGVVVIAMLLFSAIGWVLNMVKKAREAAEAARLKREAAHLQERASMHISGARQTGQASALPPSAVDAKQEAAARRAQALAQMRSQAARTGSTQPENLSIAQREARERAREAYQRRQELLARQRQAQQQAQQQQAGAGKTPAQARPQQASRPAAQPQASRPMQPSPRQAPAPVRARAPQAPQTRRVADAAIAAPMAVESLSDRDVISEPLRAGATRREADLAARAGLSPAASLLRQTLSGQSLRSAFLLKEVLDRPLALREPSAQPGSGQLD